MINTMLVGGYKKLFMYIINNNFWQVDTKRKLFMYKINITFD